MSTVVLMHSFYHIYGCTNQALLALGQQRSQGGPLNASRKTESLSLTSLEFKRSDFTYTLCNKVLDDILRSCILLIWIPAFSANHSQMPSDIGKKCGSYTT